MKRSLGLAAAASIIIITLGVLLFVESISVASASPTLVVDPKIGGKAPREFYSINITIYEVTELYAWDFNLTFNTAVLEVVSVVEGPFLRQAGTTLMPAPELNNTAGYVSAGCSRFPYDKGANGSGVLATVTFEVKTQGESPLQFSLGNTWMYTWDGSTLVDILCAKVDGLFRYPVELVHDVAVTGVTVSSLTVVAGETVSINVTVLNKGNITESFEVSLYYDSVVIGTQDVSGLISDVSRTLVFEWKTRHVAVGDYVLTATVSAVAGETMTLDNSYSFAAVTVTESSPPLPAELLVLGAVVVILVAAVILLLRKRSPKET